MASNHKRKRLYHRLTFLLGHIKHIFRRSNSRIKGGDQDQIQSNFEIKKNKNIAPYRIRTRTKYPNKIFLLYLRFSKKIINIYVFSITKLNIFSNSTPDIFGKFQEILLILVSF